MNKPAEVAQSAGRPPQLHLLAALAGWVFPGLGHYLVGQRTRAKVLAVAIGGLWFAGILLGGVSVIDHHHRVPFLGQMFVGPSVAVNYYHQRIRQRYIGTAGPTPDLEPFFEPAIGRMLEQGMLYTAIAGLLNLLSIIDVVYREKDEP